MQIGPSNSLLRALSSVLQPQPAAPAGAVRPAATGQQQPMRTIAAAPQQATIPSQQPSNPLPRGSIINIRV